MPVKDFRDHDLQLGRAAVSEDKRTLTFNDLLDAKVLNLRKAKRALPKARYAWTAFWRLAKLTMLKNDQLGDCVPVGALHKAQLDSALVGSSAKQYVATDAETVKLYSKVGGYKPGDPSTDNGAYLLDMLKYWRTTPIGGQRLLGFARLDALNDDHWRIASYLFGGLYLGLALPTSAQQEFRDGRPWSATTDQPGSWGGHCVLSADFVTRTSDVLYTWGALQPMTPAFRARYCDEAYCLLPGEWAHDIPYLKAAGFRADAFADLLSQIGAAQ
jgi:hypothetical protein